MLNLEKFFEKSAFYKEKTFQIANIIENSKDYRYRENADILRHCADRIDVNNITDGTEKILSHYCRLRYCPQCQYRKSIKQYGEIIQIAEKLNCSWLHLVLTIRNCEAVDLSKTIDKLFTSSTKLFKKYKKNFKGIIRACEVTYNKDEDTYHPHLHCLISVNKSYFTSRYYVKQSDILDCWREIINDKNNGGAYISKVTDKCASVAEVAKYCLKPLDLDMGKEKNLEVLENIYNALKNKRLLQTYGNITAEFKEIKNNYKPLVDDKDILCTTRYYYENKKFVPVAIDNKISNQVYNIKNVN